MARRKTRSVTTRGARSIAVGGDVIRSILVTGDKNQVFVGDYELLRDAYIDSWSVFKRVRLERFAAREWLDAEVDRFLAENECGYFVLEAQAGLGKTAFLAHLVKERGYLHHFVELARGLEGVPIGLKSLAAQLVRACELAPYNLDEVLPPAAGTRPDFIATLLEKAARRRKDGEKIVLVVDGLDEAGTPPGHNVLGLPEVLPEGVFFLVSQRPVPVQLSAEVPLELFPLGAMDERNLDDIGAYLSQAATWEGVRRALQESGYEESELVETLLEKSGGVWIYLHYVLSEIEQGKHRPLLLDALPNGLWQYYARFWRRWRKEHAGEWYELHLPFLSTLAAVQEDASLELLCTLTGLQVEPQLEALVEEEWRPFLAVEKGEERRYRPYHASLRDFFEGRFDTRGMSSADKGLARELAKQTSQAHARIAERYLTAWDGLEQGLPRLRDEGARDRDDRYGLRHIAIHLAQAGREEALHSLLRLEWQDPSTPRNVWFSIRDSIDDIDGYLSDVGTAWQAAEEASRCELEQGKQAASIGLELRYALMTSSLNSLAENLPPEMLAALVAAGEWTLARAGASARRLSNLTERAEALAALLPHVAPAERQTWFNEALNDAAAADPLKWQTLVKLAECLPEPRRDQDLLEIVEKVWLFASDRDRRQFLSSLAPYLTPTAASRAAVVAGAIRDKMLWGLTLAALLPSLQPSAEKANVQTTIQGIANDLESGHTRVLFISLARSNLLAFADALVGSELESARMERDDHRRADLLLRLAPLVPERWQEDVLREGLAAAAGADLGGQGFTENHLFELLTEAVRHLAPRVRDEVIVVARQLRVIDYRIGLLTEIALRVDPEQQTGLLAEIIAEINAIHDAPGSSDWSSFTLSRTTREVARLAPGMTPAQRAAVRTFAERIPDPGHRVPALAALAGFSDAEGQRVLRSALDAAQKIRPRHEVKEALAAVAPHLSRSLLLEALGIARTIRDGPAVVGALPPLAASLPEPDRHAAIELMLADDIAWEASAPRIQWMADCRITLAETLQRDVLERLTEIEDPVSRVLALCAFAQVASGERSARAIELALSTSHGIPNGLSRGSALASLLPLVSIPERERVAEEALDAVADQELHLRAPLMLRVIPFLSDARRAQVIEEALDEIHRARRWEESWEALAPALPEDVVRTQLRRELSFPSKNVAREPEPTHGKEVAPLAVRLAELGYGDEALGHAAGIESDYTWAHAVANIAHELPEASVRSALSAALELPDRQARDTAVAELSSRYAEWNPDEALRYAQQVEMPELRVNSLGDIADRLDTAAREPILRAALAQATDISDSRERWVALERLAPKLATLGNETAAIALTEALRALARRPRADLAHDLCVLTPVLLRAVGVEAAVATFHALQDVRRWWP